MRIFGSILLIIFLMFDKGAALNNDPPDVKSTKNWFTQNVKITSSEITTKDLLESPGNGDWLLYHGDYEARHHSVLKQINEQNIKKLIPKWSYKITPADTNLRSSPIVYKGIMYVTAANEVHALDAKTGNWLWRWQAYEKRSPGINRGAALYGNTVFFSTSDCQLVALDRKTGNLKWQKKYADTTLGYYSTSAPLVINSSVITGVSNDNKGSRGFVSAFSTINGDELWRFWTLPEKTQFRGAPTWMTGSYDPMKNLLYWPVGLLAEGQNISVQEKNSHDNSIVALNPGNGTLKNEFKFNTKMPYDWDANQPLVLADLGSGPDKINATMQANRNGIFYLFERTNQKLVLSKSFVRKIKWTADGTTCPPIWGATNWMAPSFDPTSGIFYVMALEGCVNTPNDFHLKALYVSAQKIYTVWDYPVSGSTIMAAGVLSTDGNIVLTGNGMGYMVALNSVTGQELWKFNLGRPIFSSPVTYLVDGRQYISLVAGSDVFTFGLYD